MSSLGLTPSGLMAAMVRAAAAMPTLENELNAADAHLGDGDTGQTLRRVFDSIARTNQDAPTDLGVTLKAMARSSASATGSSLGTLCSVALMSLGKHLVGRELLPWAELGPALVHVRDAMAKRGGAGLGDKTVLDAIDAIASKIAGLDDPALIREVALRSARATLVLFRDRPCRIGRARMFGDKSRGLDDPGMLAAVRLLEHLS